MRTRLRLLLALVGATSCMGDRHIVNGYGSTMGIGGASRDSAHTGVDFRGSKGDVVIAASDGVVIAQVDAPHGVGTCVLVEHHCARCELSVLFTSYCHLSASLVTAGQVLARGQALGMIGSTGIFSGGIDHLHFSVCRFPCVAAARDGDFTGTIDPSIYDVGCFDPSRRYVSDTAPVLTHPISCVGR